MDVRGIINSRDKFRQTLPCPDCGVDSGEFCLSAKGLEMARYIHPNRRPVIMDSFQRSYMSRWLDRHGHIFEEII